MKRYFLPVLVLAVASWAGAALIVTRLGMSILKEAPLNPIQPSDGESQIEWTDAEKVAIEAGAPSGMVPATENDAEPGPERQDLEVLYGSYEPFFVRGDLNGDGVMDFVQAYVDRQKDLLVFDVAVFFGRSGKFSPPYFVVRNVNLAAGDISIDRSLLIITEELGSDTNRRFRYDPLLENFYDVDATETEPQAPPEDVPDEPLDRRQRAQV